MDSYLDMRVIDSAEIHHAHIINALFAKVHQALAHGQVRDVAVAFPQMHERGLGKVVRLLGTQAGLMALLPQLALKGVQDHLHIGGIKPIPVGALHRQLKRVQAKNSNPERLLRRRVKRQMARDNLSEEEARHRQSKSQQRLLQLPYLSVKSSSTAKQFRLFLHLGLATTKASGEFNAYGLSQHATLPWFPFEEG